MDPLDMAIGAAVGAAGIALVRRLGRSGSQGAGQSVTDLGSQVAVTTGAAVGAAGTLASSLLAAGIATGGRAAATLAGTAVDTAGGAVRMVLPRRAAMPSSTSAAAKAGSALPSAKEDRNVAAAQAAVAGVTPA